MLGFCFWRELYYDETNIVKDEHVSNFTETITARLKVNATGGDILSITYLYQYVCEAI